MVSVTEERNASDASRCDLCWQVGDRERVSEKGFV